MRTVSEIPLLKSHPCSFSLWLILVSPGIRKRGIMPPQKQGAAGNGKHLFGSRLLPQTLPISFASSRSHSPAGKAKLFWDVCERSVELGKGMEKPQNKDVFQHPSDPWRSAGGAAAASDAGCGVGCVGHSLPAPAKWLFPFGKSFSMSKRRGWDCREQPPSLRGANSNLDVSNVGQLGRMAGNEGTRVPMRVLGWCDTSQPVCCLCHPAWLTPSLRTG